MNAMTEVLPLDRVEELFTNLEEVCVPPVLAGGLDGVYVNGQEDGTTHEISGYGLAYRYSVLRRAIEQRTGRVIPNRLESLTGPEPDLEDLVLRDRLISAGAPPVIMNLMMAQVPGEARAKAQEVIEEGLARFGATPAAAH